MNICVIGLGNALMSDDAFGPYVVRVLEAFYEVPDNVRVIDAGTPGRDLTPYLLAADAVIVVDTVEAPGPAGSIHFYQLHDVLQHAGQPRFCPHDPGLIDALRTAHKRGARPKDVLLIGVVPEWIATGAQLGRAVRAAVAPVAGLIVTELDRLGARLQMRAVPRQPDTWWERDVEARRAEAAKQLSVSLLPRRPDRWEQGDASL